MILYVIAFIIPLGFSSTQIITGTIINSFLFLSQERLSMKKMVPLFFLPSLGTIMHGVLFGPFTVYIYFFLPFIWIGNYILVYTYRSLETYHPILRIFIASFSKFCLLQLSAVFLVQTTLVPKLFLLAMGLIQLFTAISGGILSIILFSHKDHERT
jgi:hypothetical protein